MKRFLLMVARWLPAMSQSVKIVRFGHVAPFGATFTLLRLVGARSNIQDGSILHVTHDSEYAPGGSALSVGDDVTVGHNVVLHACTVEDLCLIGMGSVVLDGAVVRSGAMVGAGSLVPPNKELEGGYMWLGSPVKRVRELTDKEKSFLAYSAQHYVKLKNRHSDS